jgi:hypothetical protein
MRQRPTDASLENSASPAYPNCMKPAHGRILERLLDPVCTSLNDEAARKLIGLQADATALARADKLARKCNEDELTPEEKAEYESYVLAGEVVAVLQAKARILLSRRGRPTS